MYGQTSENESLQNASLLKQPRKGLHAGSKNKQFELSKEAEEATKMVLADQKGYGAAYFLVYSVRLTSPHSVRRSHDPGPRPDPPETHARHHRRKARGTARATRSSCTVGTLSGSTPTRRGA